MSIAPLTLLRPRRAEIAYACVKAHEGQGHAEDYGRVAKSFPSLLHQCGLSQSVAYAQAKEGAFVTYLKDLQTMLDLRVAEDIAERSRTAPVVEYLRLSRQALDAAVWLKRYAEALLVEDKNKKGEPGS